MAKGHMHGFNMGHEKTLMERNILNILHNRETKVVIQSSCPRCHSTLIVLMVEVKTRTVTWIDGIISSAPLQALRCWLFLSWGKPGYKKMITIRMLL